MDTLVFHNDDFQRLYNCSFKTYEEWLQYGVKHPGLGSLYLALGTLYLALYIPILIVMSRPMLFQYSCWRIMFFLGIVDCCSTVFSCIIPGYFGIMGTVACNHIIFFYISGGVALSTWLCQCATCTVLVLNRCIDFWKSAWMANVFEGKRTLFWISLCLGYAFLGFWYSTIPVFSSKGMAYFFDPYFMIPSQEVDLPRTEYVGVFVPLNSIAVVIFLPLLHGFLLISVWWKSSVADSGTFSKMQKQLFIQAFWICFLNFATASLYVYMQFFPIPACLIVVAQLVWQGSHGGAVFIYYSLNKTIRSGVLKMVCSPFGKYQVTHSSTLPSNSVGIAHSGA